MPPVTRRQYKKQLKLLGKLPPEVRTMIYKLVIPEGQTINLNDPPRPPAICLACPLFQTESIGLWRGGNRFELDQIYPIWCDSAEDAFITHLSTGFHCIQDLEWVKPWIVFSTKDWEHQIPDKKTDVHIKLVIKDTTAQITFIKSDDGEISWRGMW
ncbi:hypothetical protein LTR37_001480 [Vermiconidia calcicola]|uniref:Uncharacterized protein n=1 Tax=Vermiconidia calcicola TaxID=1690605 RepID=A0ACC3NVP0_9PEZI|nr:hypothetical protein LTR37_001480 [Vermiconidia calcicola]